MKMRTFLFSSCLALTFAASPAFAQAPPTTPAATPSAQVQVSQLEARKLSDAFVSVAERVSPSVVQIDVSVRDESAAIVRWYAAWARESCSRRTAPSSRTTT